MKSISRQPIKVIVAFGPITKEKIEALPEHVRRSLAELVFGSLVEKKSEPAAVKIAA